MTGKGIFVSGTGTDVGKTVVTRGLARLLLNHGVDIAAVKPVESGVTALEASDAARIAAAAGGRHSLADVSAYRFKTPVSPHLAAAVECVTIDGDLLVTFLRAWLQKADVVLAEGAGGLLVPLNDGLIFADIIAKSGYDLLIVAPDILGTINHTLLTIEAARMRGITVTGVILNLATPHDFGNGKAISHFGKVPVLGTLPRLQLDDDRLAEHLAGCIDIERLVSPR